MANLKEVRARIVTVNSTKQITSAMKMVSAAKLKRAQDAINRFKPYAEKLQDLLQNLSSSLESSEGDYTDVREEKNTVIVVITSNRGLCGGFNNNVIKAVGKALEKSAKHSNTKLICIGKKGYDAFRNSPYLTDEYGKATEHSKLFEDLSFDNAAKLVEKVMQAFVLKNVDKVLVSYNAFRNAAIQEVQLEQLLPVVPPVTDEDDNSAKIDYIFEPEKEEIVEELIPKSLKVQFYKGLLHSHASEHGARMTAMHKATDNATELIKDLKLAYNKARQAAITNEILEIVGGAEALNG